MLIEAFAQLHDKHPQLHLLIVGDGALQAELEAQVMKRGLVPNVTFAGRVSHEEVRYYIAAMDIAVSPHANFYASPMKILEYMAMAKAVVAPNLPNIRDILCHGENCLLFEPESVESLVAQLDTLLQNPSTRSAIGIAARRKIEIQRNWQHNAQQVLELYPRLVGSPPR
jgi:glycosyltransferase involved in cell wall biosynthesis